MRKMMPLLFAAMFAMPVVMTGCDRTVAEKTQTKTDSNGNVTQEKKVVTQDANGTTTVHDEKSTNVNDH